MGRGLTSAAIFALAIGGAGCATAEDAGFTFAPDGGTTKDDTAEPDEDATPVDTSAGDTGSSVDTGSEPDTAVADTTSPPADTAAPDTAIPDTAVPDTAVADTAVADTAVADTGADAGMSPGKVLIFDDGAGTLASAAVTAMGGTPTVAITGPQFNMPFDAGGINVVIIDCALNALPAGVETRVITWANGGGRLIFAYWDLDASATLRTALKIASTVSYTNYKPIFADPASSVNLFTFKQTLPSPQTKLGLPELADNGDSLTVVAGGFLAARHDSTTGTGAIAVTGSGKIVVNGFAPYNIRTNDLDADGRMDMQELYENELAYVITK